MTIHKSIIWKDQVYAVGDRVRIKSKSVGCKLNESIIYKTGLERNHCWGIPHIPHWYILEIKGTGMGTDIENCIRVNTDPRDTFDGDFFHPQDLEKIQSNFPRECGPPLHDYFSLFECNIVKEKIIKPKQTTMQKLTSMLKRLLDKDAQTLYKAGYIDGDLRLTGLGLEALNSIMFDAHKQELVKAAQEHIDEEEKKK